MHEDCAGRWGIVGSSLLSTRACSVSNRIRSEVSPPRSLDFVAHEGGVPACLKICMEEI